MSGGNKPRIGFLGIGWIGRHRMEGMLATGRIEAAGIADPSAEMIAEAQTLAPEAAVCSSLDELLDLGLDGIVIATPSAMHAAQSITALRRGVAVFCQKPLGRTEAEVAEVVEAARKADRLLGVDLSYRHTEAMRAIKALADAGELGPIHAIDLTFHNAYGPDKDWFYDPAQAGGGCVMDLGTHLVDMALWMTGFPEIEAAHGRLFAGGRRLPAAPPEVEDFAVAELSLAGGTIVRLACSWRLPAGQDAIIKASFYGRDGGAALKNVGGSFYDFRAERYRGTAREALAEPPDAWGARAAADWASRLADGARFDRQSEELVTVARALDRIYGR